MNRLIALARAAAEQVIVLLGLSLLGLILLTSTLICFAIVWPLSAARRRVVVRSAIAIAFHLYLSILRTVRVLWVDLSELDTLRDSGPLVVAPNHPCLLDAVFVLSRLPDATCIMKAELMNNVFLGAGARMAGYIRNDTPRSMVRQAIDSLNLGGQLLVFPEGTRTIREPVNPLRGAFALIAKRARVPIQIVFIETDSPFLRKGWPLWKRPELPLRYRVRLGPRIEVTGTVESAIAQVTEVYERALRPGQVSDPQAQARAASEMASDSR